MQTRTSTVVLVTAVSKTQRFWAIYHTESWLTERLMGDPIREARTLQLWHFFYHHRYSNGRTFEPVDGCPFLFGNSTTTLLFCCCHNCQTLFSKSQREKGLITVFRKDILDTEFSETCFPVTGKHEKLTQHQLVSLEVFFLDEDSSFEDVITFLGKGTGRKLETVKRNE